MTGGQIRLGNQIGFQAVKRCHGWVIQRWQRGSCAFKMRRAITMRRENFGQRVEGDFAVQRDTDEMNLADSASANTGQDFVGAQTFARQDRHGLP